MSNLCVVLFLRLFYTVISNEQKCIIFEFSRAFFVFVLICQSRDIQQLTFTKT